MYVALILLSTYTILKALILPESTRIEMKGLKIRLRTFKVPYTIIFFFFFPLSRKSVWKHNTYIVYGNLLRGCVARGSPHTEFHLFN